MIRNRRSSRRSEPYPSRPLPSSSYSDIVRSDPEIVSRLDTAGPGNRKTGAREFNQDRIARTLRDLFPIPAHKEWKIQHKQGHLLSDPILNVGRSPKSNRDNLGRWLQKCNTRSCSYIGYITKPVPWAFEADPLATYLTIRDELRPTPRKKLSSTTEPAQTPSTAGAASSSTAPSNSTVFEHVAPKLRSVLIYVWLEEGLEPKQFDLEVSLKSRYIRLEDFKMTFGMRGFEKVPVQKFIDDNVGRWEDLRWETPLKLTGDPTDVTVVMLRAAGLQMYQLLGWAQAAAHLLS